MAEIAVELVAVERMLWSGQASIVTAQTTEGEIGVLPGHEPMLGQLGDKLVAAVQGGFLSISEDKVTILAEFAVWADEIDVAEAEVAAASDDEETKALGEAKLRAVRRNQES